MMQKCLTCQILGEKKEKNTLQYKLRLCYPLVAFLSRALACIQMGLITTIFHGKIGTFEYVCEHLRSSCVNLATQHAGLVLLRCAVVSRDIM